jgi:hypothetical protein
MCRQRILAQQQQSKTCPQQDTRQLTDLYQCIVVLDVVWFVVHWVKTLLRHVSYSEIIGTIHLTLLHCILLTMLASIKIYVQPSRCLMHVLRGVCCRSSRDKSENSEPSTSCLHWLVIILHRKSGHTHGGIQRLGIIIIIIIIIIISEEGNVTQTIWKSFRATEGLSTALPPSTFRFDRFQICGSLK